MASGGENDIVVSPGANGRLSASQVHDASDVLAGADVTLVQLEVPMDAVLAAAEHSEGTLILNPAPATHVSPQLLDRVDELVPNRVELAAILDAPVPMSLQEVSELVDRLSAVDRVVTTLAADGAFVADGPEREHVPAVAVRAVDATAAGDAFCGAIADALARGERLLDAARWATAAAAVSVTRSGAQDSLPRGEEVTLPVA